VGDFTITDYNNGSSNGSRFIKFEKSGSTVSWSKPLAAFGIETSDQSSIDEDLPLTKVIITTRGGYKYIHFGSTIMTVSPDGAIDAVDQRYVPVQIPVNDKITIGEHWDTPWVAGIGGMVDPVVSVEVADANKSVQTNGGVKVENSSDMRNDPLYENSIHLTARAGDPKTAAIDVMRKEINRLREQLRTT
jgi:hypothetical protein